MTEESKKGFISVDMGHGPRPDASININCRWVGSLCYFLISVVFLVLLPFLIITLPIGLLGEAYVIYLKHTDQYDGTQCLLSRVFAICPALPTITFFCAAFDIPLLKKE